MDVRKVFNWLTKPKLKDEDSARREFILNILLLGAIFLSSIATLSAKISLSRAIQRGEIDIGAPIDILAAISLTFLALYFFSRAGKSKWVAYVFVWLYFLPAVYTSYNWGASVPQALLIYVLIIVMAGILIGTKFAFIVTILVSISLFIIFYLQDKGIISVNTVWTNRPLHFRDVSVFVATLITIALVSWLFNREIEKTLYRARRSEKALKKERDLLEIKVEERTKELKKVQLEKIQHLYRLADFGRMSAGFFHDFVNPLTVVSLNLERLQARRESTKIKELTGAALLLERAVDGTHRMESFAQAVRRQLQKQETKGVFSLDEEISQAIDVLAHKAKEAGVKIRFIYKGKIGTYGNPLRFNQLASNFVSNAIDAYEKVRRRKNREIILKLTRQDSKVILTVQDFGCGIPKKNLKKIFDPFFTTKSVEKGTGIGLSICKDIAERDFGGNIKVESKKDEGTTAIVEFPIRKHKSK